ncbi:alpha/beta fold hydrolase [Streptomyces laculatispora]|uniref:alpha/beta fold hydrolase n=1 Tax=Streptomyces laculatispora TaxID=887464 RepID=UPI001A93BB54|nr:alpha/beta hydrolase [Streptomyces laculatispora]MBO0917137.1 alpha/beta hydrolase [Streptomyces laculatispora]
MTETVRKNRRLRPAIVGICLAAALTGITACADSTPSDSGKPKSPGQSSHGNSGAPAAVQPSASAAAASLRMVENGDHSLAFQVTPGHLPALVLDAGGGEDSSYWKKMAPELARKTGSMVVTYDRAGMGKSDEVPGAWKVENAVSDLKAGLTELGITHDVILVSHSQAAEVATYFAKENPKWLSGAVLVDGSLPEFYTDEETAKIEAANQAQVAALKDQPSTQQTRQLLATADGYGAMHRAYHQVSWPLSVPATAIVSEKTPFETPEDAQLWRNAQQEFVKGAPNRDLVTAAKSSHDIAGDRPDVIVTAVGQMLKAAG